MITGFIAGLALGIAVATSWLFAKAEKKHKKELFDIQLQVKMLNDKVARVSGELKALYLEVTGN